jgi:hypothetical protein
MASAAERLEGDTGNIGAPTAEQQINTIGMGRFQYMLFAIFGLIVVADGVSPRPRYGRPIGELLVKGRMCSSRSAGTQRRPQLASRAFPSLPR